MTAAPETAIDTGQPAAPVRAQDDLFRHFNGEWLATAVIPDDRSMDGAFYVSRAHTAIAAIPTRIPPTMSRR